MQARASQDEKLWPFLFAAWAVALTSTLGALFIGEVMGQTPCLLCWYQRIFMFPLAIVLGVACYATDPAIWRYALPVAAIGWLVAAYHNLLYAGVVSEAIVPCGTGPACSSADLNVVGFIPIPLLSLCAFTAIITLLTLIRRRAIQ
ncbi:MAG: disulfide bond formation protein B [Hyphomicrobiales bacterium]|nr:disulfide bond formation protein B [Hyphomicrobiales bacterium]